MIYLEYIQTLRRRSASPCLRRSCSVWTCSSAQGTLIGHDTPLPQLFQYCRTNRLSGAVTLIALGAAVGVARAHHRVWRYMRLFRNSSGQRAVTFVRRYAGARLRIVAALAATHVTTAASIRGNACASV